MGDGGGLRGKLAGPILINQLCATAAQDGRDDGISLSAVCFKNSRHPVGISPNLPSYPPKAPSTPRCGGRGSGGPNLAKTYVHMRPNLRLDHVWSYVDRSSWGGGHIPDLRSGTYPPGMVA